MPCHSLCKMPSGRACQRPNPLKPLFLLGKQPASAETGRSGGGPERRTRMSSHARCRSRKCLKSGDRRAFRADLSSAAGRGRSRGRPCAASTNVLHNGNVDDIHVATASWTCRMSLIRLSAGIADIIVDFTNPLDIYVADVSGPLMLDQTCLKSRCCGRDGRSSGVAGCGIAIRPAADRHAAAFRPPSRRSAGANGVSIVRSASELTPSIRQGQYRRAGRGPVARRARVGERIARSVGDEVRHDRPHRLLADRHRAREGPLQEVRHQLHGEQGRELGRHPRLALERRHPGDAHADSACRSPRRWACSARRRSRWSSPGC